MTACQRRINKLEYSVFISKTEREREGGRTDGQFKRRKEGKEKVSYMRTGMDRLAGTASVQGAGGMGEGENGQIEERRIE